jgi:hypothetical protein
LIEIGRASRRECLLNTIYECLLDTIDECLLDTIYECLLDTIECPGQDLPQQQNVQRGVYEANNIGVESSVDWEQNGQFSERLHRAEKHRTYEDVSDDLQVEISLIEIAEQSEAEQEEDEFSPSLPVHQLPKQIQIRQIDQLQ